MCTLSFYPTEGGYYLTHNRDEHRLREPAMPPALEEVHGKTVCFPKDGRAGGSWIVLSETRSVCLLNGARTRHQHQAPYRLSRGLVLMDTLCFDNADAFANGYDLSGIEPFTMVWIDDAMRTPTTIYWDGIRPGLETHLAEPRLWSSSTLYSPEAQQIRRDLFARFLNTSADKSADAFLEFHLHGKTGNAEGDLVMHRPSGVMTLSVSQIRKQHSNSCFHYEDLVLQARHVQCL